MRRQRPDLRLPIELQSRCRRGAGAPRATPLLLTSINQGFLGAPGSDRGLVGGEGAVHMKRHESANRHNTTPFLRQRGALISGAIWFPYAGILSQPLEFVKSWIFTQLAPYENPFRYFYQCNVYDREPQKQDPIEK